MYSYLMITVQNRVVLQVVLDMNTNMVPMQYNPSCILGMVLRRYPEMLYRLRLKSTAVEKGGMTMI